MRLLVATLLALIAAGAFSQQTIYNTVDITVATAPGGTSCSHSKWYEFFGSSRGPFYVGIPLDSVSAPVSSALFHIKPTRCVNADRLGIFVRTIANASAQIQEQYTRGNCPFLSLADPSYDTQIDNNCNSVPVDVTAAVNAALAAGNNQLVLHISNGRRAAPPGTTDIKELNWCNPFINPGIEPKYNDQNNCGIYLESREFNPSSFYIVVNGAAPSTAPTSATPTTATPTSTASPSTAAPTSATPSTTTAPSTPVSGSCSGSNVSGPNVASPGRSTRTVVCSGNGYCNGNSCTCLPGFEGVECQTRSNSNTCQANVSGPNVASPARGIKTTQCSGNGYCQEGKCVCNGGFVGTDCEKSASPTCANASLTVSGCNGNGYCLQKVCICNAGFSGIDCQNAETTTAAPSIDSPSSTAQISGDNNARSDQNSATTIVSVFGMLYATIVAFFL